MLGRPPVVGSDLVPVLFREAGKGEHIVGGVRGLIDAPRSCERSLRCAFPSSARSSEHLQLESTRGHANPSRSPSTAVLDLSSPEGVRIEPVAEDHRLPRSRDQRAPDSGRYRADPASLTSARFVGATCSGAPSTSTRSQHEDGTAFSAPARWMDDVAIARHQRPDGVQLATTSGNSCSPSDVLGVTPGRGPRRSPGNYKLLILDPSKSRRCGERPHPHREPLCAGMPRGRLMSGSIPSCDVARGAAHRRGESQPGDQTVGVERRTPRLGWRCAP